jgi:hypothetical protein
MKPLLNLSLIFVLALLSALSHPGQQGERALALEKNR